MAVYPTLSVTPQVANHRQTRAADPTLRTPFEGGYVQTRPRFTRIPRRWSISYAEGNALPAADKTTLYNFESARGVGGEAFTWTSPFDGGSYTVRFAAPIEFAPVTGTATWSARFDLEEV